MPCFAAFRGIFYSVHSNKDKTLSGQVQCDADPNAGSKRPRGGFSALCSVALNCESRTESNLSQSCDEEGDIRLSWRREERCILCGARPSESAPGYGRALQASARPCVLCNSATKVGKVAHSCLKNKQFSRHCAAFSIPFLCDCGFTAGTKKAWDKHSALCMLQASEPRSSSSEEGGESGRSWCGEGVIA